MTKTNESKKSSNTSLSSKEDLLSEKDFTILSKPIPKHHYPLPSDAIPSDENNDQLKETLMGMEYDIESNEKVETDNDEIPDEDLDYLMSEDSYFDKESDTEADEDDYFIDEDDYIETDTNGLHPNILTK